jgi:hypothetical protein
MRIELTESCTLRATRRTCKPAYSNQDEGSDLVISQINFGLAYTHEARSAFESGNYDYAEVARKIALNAYSAAVRFSAHLLKEPQPALIRQIEQLEIEIDGLPQPVEAEIRSIA